jgi:phage terminase small subunit
VERVGEFRGNLREKCAITQERVLREIARLAFFDVRKLFDAEGRPKPVHELDDDTAAAISQLDIDELGRVKYRLADKGVNLERLAKHLGLFERDNAQRTGGFLADLPRELVQLMVDRLRQLKAAGG